MSQTFPKLAASAPQQKETHHEVARDESIDFGAIFSTLWRGKWLLALCLIVGTLSAAIYGYVIATPLYSATSVVILETQEDRVTDLESVIGGFSGDSAAINSEVEVLRSRSLMKKVVARLDLVSDPEFNPSLREPGLKATFKGEVRKLVERFAPSLAPSQPEPATDSVASRGQTEAVVSSVIQRLHIRNIPQTLVLQISVTSQSAEKSALIADTVAELYVLNQIEVKFEATEQATAWLSERVTQLQRDLEVAEARVKEFNAGTTLVSAESLAALERQLKDQRDRIQMMRANLQSNQQRLEALRSATGREEQLAVASDTRLTQFYQQAQSTPSRMAAFDLRYSQIVERAELDLQRSESQVAALETAEAGMEQEIARQGQDLIKLQQLTRDAEATRLLYEHFLSRLKETAAQEGIQQSDSRVLSDAVVPFVPSQPQKSRILAFGGLFGLIVGGALVALLELRQNTYRTASDLERGTGRAVIGQVPLLPARSRRDAISYLKTKPTSAAAEAIRNLRTSVLLANVDKPPQVIVCTSSIPGEGKTVLSLALAQNFVGMDKKVLLIEGDIRRRMVSRYLKTKNEKGLVSALSSEAPLEEFVIHDDSIGVDVLIGEQSSANAADIFSSDSFKRILASARKKYDQIIIDTPPVLVVPDARIIAQQSDALLFVVRWDSTSKPQVSEALRMFDSIGQPVNGIVLNQINPRGMKRYGYGGKYGAYSTYGRKYYNN